MNNIFRHFLTTMVIFCTLLWCLSVQSSENQLSQKTKKADPSVSKKSAEPMAINTKTMEELIAVATDSNNDLEIRRTAIKSLEAVLSKADKEIVALGAIALLQAGKGSSFVTILQLMASIAIPITVALIGVYVGRKLEGVKSDWAARFHTRSTRYNKEFELYQQIWKSCVTVKNNMRQLQKSIAGIGDTPKSNLVKCIQRSADTLAEKLDESRPFFDKAIYVAMDDLNRATQEEADELQEFSEKEQKNKEYWNQRNEGAIKINKLFEKCEEVIRRRIENLDMLIIDNSQQAKPNSLKSGD